MKYVMLILSLGLAACAKSKTPEVVCSMYAPAYIVQNPTDLTDHKSTISVCSDGLYHVQYVNGSGSFEAAQFLRRLPNGTYIVFTPDTVDYENN